MIQRSKYPMKTDLNSTNKVSMGLPSKMDLPQCVLPFLQDMLRFDRLAARLTGAIETRRLANERSSCIAID